MTKLFRDKFAKAILGLLLLAISGCSAIQTHRNESMDKELVSGNYQAAALMAEDRIGIKKNADGTPGPITADGSNTLNHLDAGASWMLSGDPQRSASHFDAAEYTLKSVETQNMVASGGKLLGATLISESIKDYVPSPAEAVLINYYKALDFLQLGDVDNARVELNRSADRTRRAVERYASEIEAAQAKASGASAAQSYSDPKVKSGVDKNFPEMDQWVPYKDFIVPPASYLQALFLGRSSEIDDRQQAGDLYTRLMGIVEQNPFVAQDANEVSHGKICPKNNCKWILVEHGLGPDLQERRFDLPIFTLNGMVIASIAVPSFHSRTTTDEIPVKILVDHRPITIPLLGSMDRVIQVEFKKRFPGVVTRAVVSSAVKAIAQNEVNKQNPLFGLVANVVSMATTGADVRSWRGTPGRWSLARFNGGAADSAVTVETPQGPVEVNVPSSGSHLIYVRAISSNTKPVVQVINL